MSKQEKSRKPLIIGIIAAVVILAVLLALLLTQCVGGQGEATVPTTTVPSDEVPEYQLYWNLDRAKYDGKSEAGMSSRMPEADGYFHVRFFAEGEEVTLKVADRRLINSIDVQDVMGLEFDEDGIVIGVLNVDEMPLEKVGWQFYVQSAARTIIKLNSSESLDGMEVLLDDLDPNRVWDMSGKSGPIGNVDEAIEYDRIMAFQNLAGKITHVFIYERPNYMLSHEAYCEHCKETVMWSEWDKEGTLPLVSGHYQLQNDVQLKAQAALKEDAKLCLDLNGHRVDGNKSGGRVIAMFNPGITLAIMDTSEEQTGVLAAHEKVDQGGVVWVRYGAFYLYSGTLDASDAYGQRGGIAVECGKDKFFFMLGGTIIGGRATYIYNAEKNIYGNALGGTLSIGGKFVMDGGEIRGGHAEAAVVYKNGKIDSHQSGYGGNIFFSGTAEFEMNGGTIKNGRAGAGGGNIYADGTSELNLNGGSIVGGTVYGKGRNGGSVYVSSKATVNLKGTSIYGGVSQNCAGNVYLNGTLNMSGGYIGGGVCYDYNTRKVKAEESSVNLFVVNGKLTMWGGTVVGGVSVIDSKANDKKQPVVALYGYAKIDGSTVGRNLTISGNNDGVKVIVGNMYKGAKIGVNTTLGIFTEPTKEEYKQYFYSDIEDSGIIYYNERLALGRISCICGNSKGETVSDNHINGCNGEVLLWAPWTSTGSIPTTTGNFYLLKNVTTNRQTIVGAGKDVKLDLNGKNITLQVQPYTQDGFRLYRADNGAKLAITDTTDKPGTLHTVMPGPDAVYPGKTVKTKAEVDENGKVIKEAVYFTEEEMHKAWTAGNFGMLLWSRGGEISVHNGIFDGSNLTGSHNGMLISVTSNTVTDAVTGEKTVYPGVLNLYNGTVIGGYTSGNGNINIGNNGTMNMYGGTITGGRGNVGGNINILGTLNMYAGTVTKGVVDRSEEAVDGGLGGNINIAVSGKVIGTMNMYGGVVSDGSVKGGQKGGGHGGNIHVFGTLNATGGVIRNGVTSSAGGNIATIGANSLINLDGVQVLDGQAITGGNVAIVVRTNKGLNILGKTVVSGGEARVGGNVAVNMNVGNTTVKQDQIVVIDGATIIDGTAENSGGNIYLNNPTKANYKVDEKTGEKKQSSYMIDMIVTVKNATISGGISTGGTGHVKGGNIYIFKAKVSMDNTKVLDGAAIGPDRERCYSYGGNIYIDNAESELYLKNGSVVSGGKTSSLGGYWSPAGNIYISNGKLDITDSTISGGSGSDSHNIYLSYNTSVHMHSGTIENTTSGSTSIMMQGGTFTMDGGTIINKAANARNISSNDNSVTYKSDKMDENGNVVKDKNGNAVKEYGFAYFKKRPTLVINDGVITGGEAPKGGDGGNIYAAPAMIIEMNGGTISNGKAANQGGNIFIDKRRIEDPLTTDLINAYYEKFGTAITEYELGGQLIMNGGTITGGVSTAPAVNAKNGGNICAGLGSTVTISGKAVVSDGQSNNMGGNIYTNGRLIVSGGTISGGKAKNSQNVFIVNGSLTMSGGVIDGGVGMVDTSATDAYVCEVKMSGKPVINETNNGLSLPNAVDIQLDGTLEKGASVWISTSLGHFSTETVKANTAGFHSVKGYEVLFDSDRLFIGEAYCLCGASKVGSNEHQYWCDGEHAWQPWSGDHFTVAGYYFMEKSLSSGQRNIGVDTPAIDVVLDLAGYTYTGGTRAIRLNRGSFGLTDTSAYTNAEGDSIGKLIGMGPADSSHAGVVLMSAGTEMNIFAGEVTLQLPSGRTVSNGGIVQIFNKSTVNMYGGSMVGGSTRGNGGNVYVSGGGTFNFYGGLIADGHADTGRGGNIVTYTNATVNMMPHPELDPEGKLATRTITGGVSVLGGNIYATETPLVMVGVTVSDGYATCTDTQSVSGGNIYLSQCDDVQITDSTITGGKAIGTDATGLNEENETVYYHANVGNMHVVGGSVVLDNTTVSNGEAQSGNNSRSYSYAGNMHLDSCTVTLQNGSKVTGGAVTNRYTRSTWHPAGNIFITKGTLEVLNSEISGGVGKGSANNIYMYSPTTTKVILGDGAVVRNSVAGSSDNIGLGGGTLTIRDGAQIINDEGILARNIHALAEGVTTIDMSGGEITGGVANDSNLPNGGNIFFEYDGGKRVQAITFNMSGGVISNGTSTTGEGGNLYVTQNTTVNMSGNAQIKDGEAFGAGGNIALYAADGFNGGKLTVSGDAQITGGKNAVNSTDTSINGGSIYGHYYTVIELKDNAKVLNGDSVNCAGNIYTRNILKISGNAEISGGKRKGTLYGSDSANVYIVNGTLDMSGGTIDGSVSVTNTNASAKARVLFSGDPVINKNSKNFGLTLNSSAKDKATGTRYPFPYIQAPKALTDGAEIWVDTAQYDTVISTETVADNLKYIHAVDAPAVNLYYIDEAMTKASGADAVNTINGTNGINDQVGKLYLGNYYCVCGATGEDHLGTCGGEKLVWKAWTDLNTTNGNFVAKTNALPMETGNWYLVNNVSTASNNFEGKTGTRNIVLDLNGFNIESKNDNARMYRIYNGGTVYLTLTNSNTEKGKIVSTQRTADQGGIVWGGQEINVYNVTIDGSAMKLKETAYLSGVVLSSGGKMNLYGTTNIIGGDSIRGQSALEVTGSGKLYMDPTVNVSGEIYVGDNAKINMAGLTDVSKYTVNASGSFTTGNTITDKAKLFTPHQGAAAISVVEGEQYAGAKYYCICGASLTDGKHANFKNAEGKTVGCDEQELLWRPWRNPNAQPKASGNWYLTTDVTVNKESSYNSAVNINIDLNDHTLQMIPAKTNPASGQRMFLVNSVTANITVTNSNQDGNAATGVVRSEMKSGENGMLICLTQAGPTMNIYGGIWDASAVSMNENRSGGVGSIVAGTLNIYGGEFIGATISASDPANGNTFTADGGAFAIDASATMNMFDGTIRGGKLVGDKRGWDGWGGNVRVRGIMNMYGGLITDGEAAYNRNNGDNVAIRSRKSETATLNMYGGTIAGGIAVNNENGNAKITLAGKPVIDKSLTSEKATVEPTFSLRPGTVVVDVKDLTGGTVYVTAAVNTQVAKNATSSDLTKYVLSEVTYGDIVVPVTYRQAESALYLGNEADTYCTCGASREDAYTCQCDGSERVWVQWTDQYSLPTAKGSYYLAYDVTPDKIVSPADNAEIVIDLRGNDIILDENEDLYNFVENGNAKVILTDSTDDPTKVGSVVISGTTDADGGMFVLDSKNTFEMYRVTLDASGLTGGANAEGEASQGGVAFISANSSMVIHSGTVKGASFVEAGSFFLYNGGQLTLENGTIEGGKSPNASGGNIVVLGKGSKLTMNGGKIIGGEAKTGGGNIHLNTSAEFIMNDGEISGGIVTGTDGGGNVRVTGESFFTMNGGEISGGTVNGTSDIDFNDVFIQNSAMTMTDGEIKGAAYVQQFEERTASLTLSGSPVINMLTMATHDTNENDSVYPTLPLITISSALETGSSIGINGAEEKYMKDVLFSTADVAVNTASVMFFSDVTSDQEIGVITEQYVNESNGKFSSADIGKLYIGQIHCVCGGLVAGQNDFCDHSLHIWHPTKVMPAPTYKNDTSVYYYLTQSVEEAENTYICNANNAENLDSFHLYLDLNGYNITESTDGSRLFCFRTRSVSATSGGPNDCSVTLTNTADALTDADKSTITVSGKGDQGRLVWTVDFGGSKNNTFRMFNLNAKFNGTVNGQDEGTVQTGGLICLTANGSGYFRNVAFTSDNATASAYNGFYMHVRAGSNAKVVNSSFTNARTASEGAEFEGGGAIHNNGELTLVNTTVSGNTSSKVGGGIYMGPAGKLTLSGISSITGNTAGTATNNVYAVSGAQIILADDFAGSFGLNGAENRAIVTSVTTWDNAWYTAGRIAVDDSTNQQIMIFDGGLGLTSTKNIIQCACGGKAVGVGDHQCKKLVFIPWTSETELPTTAGNYILKNDNKRVALAATWQPEAGKVTNIDLNGHTVEAAADAARLGSTSGKTNATISITDSASGGMLKASAGTYTHEGGIFWLSSNGNLNLYAGTLDGSGHVVSNAVNAETGATVEKNGGLITVPGGATFKMYGGTIQNGRVSKYYDPADTTKAAGYSARGGNVSVSGTMYMYGGTIKDGRSVDKGGNIYVYGKLYIIGSDTVKPEISGGINAWGANGLGGNIYIHGTNAEFTVENAKIINGGLEKGTVLDGVTIGAENYGGNIAVSEKGAKVFEIRKGTEISGGWGNRGGNIYIGGLTANFETYRITGGTIANGNDSYMGSNICLYDNTADNNLKLTISGGEISLGDGSKEENVALGASNKDANYAVIDMNGGTIKNGKIVLYPNNVLNVSGTASIVGCTKALGTGMTDYGTVNGAEIN